LEASAEALHEYAPRLVPDLLQTPEYARAAVLREHPHASPEELARRVEVRLARRGRLGEPGGPRLWAIVDEAALLRAVGGREVHAAQIEALVDAAKQPEVTLQVLRLGRPGYLPRCGAFTVMRFAEADIVYLDQLGERRPLDHRRDVDAHRLAHTQLSATAAMPGETTDVLTEIRAAL
jgi:hypothetical protein